MKSMRAFGLMAAFGAALSALPAGGRRSAPRGYRIIRRLNRSQRWKRATSYIEARALSPFPQRPVR